MIDTRELDRQRIVALLWTYFVLLILEGALRKWVFPGLSDVLLIVRDPIAVAIIVLAIRSGFLVFEGVMRGLGLIAGALVVLAALQMMTGETQSFAVIAFGLRTYILHPPLIFVMGRALNGRDLRRIAFAVTAAMAPIALLMVEQFRSAPNDWINLGAGEGRTQIMSALGHVRPAGPFSFISGPVLFFGLGLACLIGTQFGRGRDLQLARYAGWAALVVAGSVSGSRSFVIGLAPVLTAAIAVLTVRPQVAGSMARSAGLAVLIVCLTWSSSTVQQGLEVFSARLELTDSEDLFARTGGTYKQAELAWGDAPLLGVGLGLGTNAGNALLSAGVFRFGEGDWSRVIFEAGPIVGLAYLVWRVWLAWWLLRLALLAASDGYVLPLLCFGACATNLVAGSWGQPTTQGFAVWIAGMAVAACRVPYSRPLVAARRRERTVNPVGRPADAAI